jgi:hypothetical protein
MIKLKMVKWTGRVTCVGRKGMIAKVLWKNRRGHLEDLGVVGRILLSGMLRKHGDMACTRLISSDY